MSHFGLVQQRQHRRKDRSGFSNNFITHFLHGSGVIGLTPIVTGDVFPSRAGNIMFQTRIRITANGGVHRGLIFELGGSARGAAAWVGDQTIGITAGSGTVANDRATATWDFGAELPVGREFQLTFAIQAGSGRVRFWDGGNRRAAAISVNGDFNGDWADTNNGSFALALVGTITPGVPAASQIAPSGFEVIAPLNVYNNQVPRSFV
jgi:hypothetical protein